MAVTEELPHVALEPGAPAAELPTRYWPDAQGWLGRGLVWAGVAFVVLLLPLFQPAFRANSFSKGVVYAIIGLSLNVLIGYTGQISLGHQAFVGVGAFTSAYMVSEAGQSFAVAVGVAVAVGGLQALILGGVALRVRGLYFALVTLSYGLLAQEDLFKIRSLTGGSAGQAAPRPSLFASDHRYYYLCLAFLGAVLWVDWRMMRTKGGRALLAVRENPRVAASMGINVRAFTLFAFVVAGAFAGLGGALLAHQNTRVVNVTFDFSLALTFVIMTVVGGLRSRAGIVIGSVFFALLDFLIKAKLPLTNSKVGLERPLARFDLTLPIVLILIGAVVLAHSLRRRRTLPALIAAVVVFLSLLVLSPVTVPYFEGRIRKIPVLPPEIAALVIGPLLLLVTLTQFPGGIGQQIRPFVRWLLGHRLDFSDRGEKEVVVTDVRA